MHEAGGRAVRKLRALWHDSTVSLLAGIAGGVLLGWLLSRGGNGWFAPVPWLVYLIALGAITASISLLWPTVRRSAEPTSTSSSDAPEPRPPQSE
jgi:F0F1-type ATP synthase assembly protein I